MARGLRSQFVSKPPGGSALWTDPRLAPFLADRFFETAALSVAGTLAATLTPPQLAATGRIPVRGTSSQPVPLPSLAATARVHVKATAGLAALSPTLSGAGNVPVRGAGFAILQGIVLQGGGAVIVPAIPGFDYAPPVDLDSSAIIAQALRFMQLPPIARIPGGAELRPALADAFSAAIDDCLSACDWTFASTLAVLPAGLPSGTGDDSLTTVSVLPSDCLAVRRVTPAGARWRIDGRLLRSDAPAPVTVRYTGRITVEPMLPATFKTAVALTIASHLGGRWASGAADPTGLADVARRTLKQAMKEDSIQTAAERAIPLPDLGYGAPDSDWALEATA